MLLDPQISPLTLTSRLLVSPIENDIKLEKDQSALSSPYSTNKTMPPKLTRALRYHAPPSHEPAVPKRVAYHLFTTNAHSGVLLGLFQERLGHLILLSDTATPTSGFQVTSGGLLYLLSFGCLLQPLRVLGL